MTQTLTSPAPAKPESDQIIVKALGLTKVFRDFWLRNRVTAVDQIDLEIRKGEVFGLLGPNGSGKSTTIKMILGLLHPTGGKLAVFGRHPRDVAIKEQIGYLPEESYLYRFLNARETLEYYAKLFHLPHNTRKRRIDQLLEFVGLDKVARRPIGEYSKGMQRRIGLAQALINDPQFLILDEPTTGLDPIGTRQVKDIIRQLAERGKTILLCSHLLADVEEVTDRVAIMFGGKVRAQGTIDQLLEIGDVTTIETETLTDEDVQAVEAALAARGKSIDAVQRPRMKLETLFLDIVHKAQQSGAATSGAGAGTKMADFLTAESAHMPEGQDAARLVEGLMSVPQAPAGPVTPGASEAVAASAKPEPAAPKPPAAPAQGDQPKAPAAPSQASKGADLDAINELLGGDAAAPAPPTPAKPAEGAAPAQGEAKGEKPDAQLSEEERKAAQDALKDLLGD